VVGEEAEAGIFLRISARKDDNFRKLTEKIKLKTVWVELQSDNLNLRLGSFSYLYSLARFSASYKGMVVGVTIQS
jgi:hypothetical protein